MPSLLPDETQSVHNRGSKFRRKLFPQFSPFLSNTAKQWRLPFLRYGGAMLARHTQRTVPHNESCGRIIQRRWQINAMWIWSISWMTVTRKLEALVGKRCYSSTSPTTNPILSEWGRDWIRVTDSNAQQPWGTPSQSHVTGWECCLARSETAIKNKHSKFKRRRQRPTSDPVLNYCQWDKNLV